MDVLYKTLFVLCLSSAAFGLQLLPSLNIKTPFNLDVGINTIKPKSQSTSQSDQCFCIPDNANSELVINSLDETNKYAERLVVYLYKIDGRVKVYIPNKNKQVNFPELHFDENEGDILVSAPSDSLIELFNPNSLNSINKITFINDDAEDNVKETETMDVQNDNLLPSNSITDTDYISSESSNKFNLPEEDLEDGNVSVVSSQVADESENQAIQYPESNEQTNIDNGDQFIDNSPSETEATEQTVAVTDNQESEVAPELGDSDSLQTITTVLPPLDTQSSENKDKDIQNQSDINSTSDDSANLQNVISFVPDKFQTQTESSLQQKLYPNNPLVKTYITFNNWFDLQIKRIVLYNLGTPSKYVEIRERVKKILLDNGMQISAAGILTDVNGNLVQMSNIKLRPILIGAPIDPHSFVNTNLAETGVSYVQLIEVIFATPPKLLGTVVAGTVYLPRNIQAGNRPNIWNDYRLENAVPNPLGCASCKLETQNPYAVTGLLYPPVYGNYDGFPFRRNFNKRKPVVIPQRKQIPFKGQRFFHSHKVVSTASKSGLGTVFDGLLGTLGVRPTVMFNPTRRLLAGGAKGQKAGPQSYPNDVLPGFRIIGGNAATSSGPPLANKGRSAYTI